MKKTFKSSLLSQIEGQVRVLYQYHTYNKGLNLILVNIQCDLIDIYSNNRNENYDKPGTYTNVSSLYVDQSKWSIKMMFA